MTASVQILLRPIQIHSHCALSRENQHRCRCSPRWTIRCPGRRFDL